MSLDTCPPLTPAAVLGPVGALTAAESLLVVQQAQRLGQTELTRALLCELACRFPEEPAVALAQQSLGLALGMARQQAYQGLLEWLARRGDDPVLLFQVALVERELEQLELARQRLERLLAICPEFPGAAGMLASLVFPGPGYRDVLAWLHGQLRPRGYLEIGVESGQTLHLASGATRAIGVDPELGPLRRDWVPTAGQVFALTSDDFFARHQRAELFGEVPLDLVFIDGLHCYDAALRDLGHVESWAHAGTVVLLHDVLPPFSQAAQRQRETRFWVGDTWKSLVALTRARTDLSITLIPTAPSGLASVRGLCGAGAFAFAAQLSQLIEELAALQLSDLPPLGELAGLRVVPNNPAGWELAVGTPFQRL